MVGATDASDRLHDVGLSTMKTWKIAAALAVGGVAAAGLIGLGVGDGAGRGGDAEADPTQERTAAAWHHPIPCGDSQLGPQVRKAPAERSECCRHRPGVPTMARG